MFPTNLPAGLMPTGAQVRPLDLLRLLESASLGYPGLAAPAVAVTPIGTAIGTTSYSYQVTAVSALGTISTVSPVASVNNVPALSNAAFNRINWSPVPDAAGYVVTRSAGGPSQGIIAVVTAGKQCEPAGALVPPSFPLMPALEVHDTGLPVLADG
ncbi:MAG TPA: hypothetical protein VIN93_02160 [Bryobacteraceae bacterium]